MSKNFFIILLAALLIVSIFTRGCGEETPNNTRVEDSLTYKIFLKQDTINILQKEFDNLYKDYAILVTQKNKIKYETLTIWKDKPATDSVINAYSDTTTVRKFLERYYTY